MIITSKTTVVRDKMKWWIRGWDITSGKGPAGEDYWELSLVTLRRRCELVVTSRPAGLMVVGQLEVMRNQKASTFGFGERENVWSYRNIGKIGREGEKEGVSLYTTLLFPVFSPLMVMRSLPVRVRV